MERALLLTTVFLVIAINVLSTLYVLSLSDSLTATAKATNGQANICVNAPPTLSVPCNTTVDQGELFTCQLGFSDVNSGQNWTFSAVWQGTPIFAVTSNGTIQFTPTNDDTGNHSVLLIVDDQAGCTNSVDNETFNFTIVDINDPPILLSQPPDIEFVVNTTTLAYFLNDYFRDPDGDPLTYTATVPGIPFTLSLVGGVGVRVSADFCADDDDESEADVIFTATDPFNESVSSDPVELTVVCPEDEAEDDDSEGEGGGSGGGGGGGFSGLCESKWECLDWMACLPTGFEWQQCYDLNGCEDPKFFKRECTYVGETPECEENWLCEQWSACTPDRNQSRDCFDLNECGTEFFKPFIEQQCMYLATCSDGILNGDEIDVDCGGSCPACPVVETPAFIEPQQFNYWLLAFMLLALILVGGVYRFYRENVIMASSRLLLWLTRRREKEILLSQEEKNLFLERILGLEQLVLTRADLSDADRYTRVTGLAREFFQTLARLPENYTKEEFLKGIRDRKISQELEHLLVGFFDKVYAVEEHELLYDKAFFFSLTEEIRLFVCEVSEYALQDVERPLEHFEITEDMSFLEEMFIRLIGAYRALQFEQYEYAKREYREILSVYESLPVEDKEAMFGETAQVFNAMRYSLEHAALETE